MRWLVVVGWCAASIATATNLEQVQCPPGMYRSRGATPTQKSMCYPCPVGTFSDEWSSDDREVACKSCPAGTFGSSKGLASPACSGLCEPGYFCPASLRVGSKSSREKECGGNVYFCPHGSKEQTTVSTGYYSVGQTNFTRTDQSMCEPGHYCVGGVRFACPRGTYNQEFGSSSKDDCIPTRPGFYAREGSTEQVPCPPGTYTSTGDTGECSRLCEEGHYCEAQSISQKQAECEAGLIGGTRGLTTNECSSVCDTTSGYCVAAASACPAGFYCPSASPEPIECGAANVYCPPASPAPVPVSAGYYSTGSDSESTRTTQAICPKGHYCKDGVKRPCPRGRAGVTLGLASYQCSGACTAGWYCREGSTSLYMNRCGRPDLYCPQGSAQVNEVSVGHYLIGGDATTRVDQVICTPGHYCERGIQIPCPAGTYSPEEGLDACKTCPKGHYCPQASVRPEPCPAGRYGDTEGLKDEKCSGPCKAGFFCTQASTNATQFMCSVGAQVPPKVDPPRNGVYGAEAGKYYGAENGVMGMRPKDSVYCPQASSAPVPVSAGFFAHGGKSGARTYQLECDKAKQQWESTACVDVHSF